MLETRRGVVITVDSRVASGSRKFRINSTRLHGYKLRSHKLHPKLKIRLSRFVAKLMSPDYSTLVQSSVSLYQSTMHEEYPLEEE